MGFEGNLPYLGDTLISFASVEGKRGRSPYFTQSTAKKHHGSENSSCKHFVQNESTANSYITVPTTEWNGLVNRK